MSNAIDAITVIEPKKGWIPLDVKELWAYRELFYFLTKRDIKVSLAVKDLLLITRQAELASPERGGSVKYSLKKGALHVAAASQTVQFEDEIPVDYKGDEFTIAFNPEYVIDGLKAMGGEKVTLSLTTPINPALFEPEGQEEYKYVIMPMRV